MDRPWNLIKLLNVKKEKLVPFLIFIGVISIVFIVAKALNLNLNGLALIFFFIVFSILFLTTWFMAGIAVFRSAIVASVSLSIIIFLAKTYCDLPIASHTADNALKSLFGFGLIYSLILFVNSLYKELMGSKESKGSLKKMEEVYGGKKPWTVMTLYAIFIGIFLWQLYQVMMPIFLGLCIYK